MVENKKQNKKQTTYESEPCPKCGKPYTHAIWRRRRLFGTARYRLSTRYYHNPSTPNLSDTFGLGTVCHVWE